MPVRIEAGLPIRFEQTGIDGRFTHVQIWIAHVGENRNNSIFSKEVLEAMIPSLANIPITGFIAVKDDGTKDFTAHVETFAIQDEKLKRIYLGSAYGVIPEDNEAHFETKYGDDGVEREYLVVNGILWNKFTDAIDIFERDEGVKPQSMELLPSDLSGYFDEFQRFVVTGATFEGACILGEDVPSAMVSSTISTFSANGGMKTEFSKMLTEFNRFYSQAKGDNILTDKEKELKEKEEAEQKAKDAEKETETPAATKPDESETTPTPDPDPDPAEDTETETETETEIEQEGERIPEEVANKFTLIRNFELEQSDVRRQMWNKIDDHMHLSGHDGYYDILDVFQTYTIVSDWDGRYFKVEYSVSNDETTFGSVTEVFPMFLTADEKSAIDNSRTNYSALETEAKELCQFKQSVEMEQKKQVLGNYSSVLKEDEYKAIESKLVNFSVEDIEREVGFLMLKQNRFSAQPQGQEAHNRVYSSTPEEKLPYGDLSRFFYK